MTTQQQKTPQMLWHATSQADTQQGDLFSFCFNRGTKTAKEDSQCSSQPTALIACYFSRRYSPAKVTLNYADYDAGSFSFQCHGILPAAPGAECPPQCYSHCCGPQQLHSMSASKSFDNPQPCLLPASPGCCLPTEPTDCTCELCMYNSDCIQRVLARVMLYPFSLR